MSEEPTVPLPRHAQDPDLITFMLAAVYRGQVYVAPLGTPMTGDPEASRQWIPLERALDGL